MPKLCGPDEGYENYEKVKLTKPATMYSTVRGKIADLICDLEVVIIDPTFNPVIDLEALPHKEFVERAEQVMTPLNPEGHPLPDVLIPTMENLLDRLEISRFVGQESYASVANPNRSPSPVSSPSSYNGSIFLADCSTPIEEETSATDGLLQAFDSQQDRVGKQASASAKRSPSS